MAVELDVDAAPVAAEPKVPPQLLFIHQVNSIFAMIFLVILEMAPAIFSSSFFVLITLSFMMLSCAYSENLGHK